MCKVLIINPYYLPGYKSGGPQRTIENLVSCYGKSNEIYILTQDHDFGENNHYVGIKNNIWNKVGDANVMYVTSREFLWRSISDIYEKFDVIYSCGLFEQNSVSLLLVHRLKRDIRKKIYIAPMGVFSEGAFYNRSYVKKRLFISVYKTIGAFNNIIWSFTTVDEASYARKILGNYINNYIIAEDLPGSVDFEKYKMIARDYVKECGKLNIVYISRIPPKKNLLYALKLLSVKYDGWISYDIYGIKEDENYWDKCEKVINSLPSNIKVNYCGILRPNQVVDTFSKYDAFLFPTQGENYGHVIYESLSAGCIPIISDQTPWDGGCLIRHNLRDVIGFRNDIKKLQWMDAEEMIAARIMCINYAEESYGSSIRNSGYNNLFQ